jgi:hypothetical protein
VRPGWSSAAESGPRPRRVSFSPRSLRPSTCFVLPSYISFSFLHRLVAFSPTTRPITSADIPETTRHCRYQLSQYPPIHIPASHLTPRTWMSTPLLSPIHAGRGTPIPLLLPSTFPPRTFEPLQWIPIRQVRIFSRITTTTTTLPTLRIRSTPTPSKRLHWWR